MKLSDDLEGELEALEVMYYEDGEMSIIRESKKIVIQLNQLLPANLSPESQQYLQDIATQETPTSPTKKVLARSRFALRITITADYNRALCGAERDPITGPIKVELLNCHWVQDSPTFNPAQFIQQCAGIAWDKYDYENIFLTPLIQTALDLIPTHDLETYIRQNNVTPTAAAHNTAGNATTSTTTKVSTQSSENPHSYAPAQGTGLVSGTNLTLLRIEPGTSNNIPNSNLVVHHGPEFVDRKSVFQAHFVKVASMKDVQMATAFLLTNNKVAKSTHNMVAYRFAEEVAGRRILHQDHDSDGEGGAGSGMQWLIDTIGVDGVYVMVSRWYGGIQLGPARFKHINRLTRDIIEQHARVPKAKN